ncbi:P-II family nitrogen regulator [Methylococcus mesophilus]|uniref:P-II family nitrogen regulator n=1 Tax=Methylococcus mesophilus TaxID=2993564 RepID=UPI00224A8B3C|nr:P-II family nitrogen regulator [Methylococcus mesophilus]UZR29697.1 P-II family nitrogen regulator [Methylococcus mesophilus]
MKEIKAVIQPYRLRALRNAFRRMTGFPGMSVWRVEGCSSHEGEEVHDSLRCELTDFSHKVRIEILAEEAQVEEIIRIIYENTHSGRLGDGIVWVTPVEQTRRLSE